MASVESNKMLAAAADAGDEKKAEDIRILALDPSESGLTDYFLICTGTNDRQTVAITDEIELRLKREFGAYPNSVEGRRQGEWILMDYVDFIVHVFLPEKRAYYGLERLRPSATTLSVADLNAEIKSAILAKRSRKGVATTAATDETIDDSSSEAGEAAALTARSAKKATTPKPSTIKSPAKRATAALKKAAKKAVRGSVASKASGFVASKAASAKSAGAKAAASSKKAASRKFPAKGGSKRTA